MAESIHRDKWDPPVVWHCNYLFHYSFFLVMIKSLAQVSNANGTDETFEQIMNYQFCVSPHT